MSQSGRIKFTETKLLHQLTLLCSPSFFPASCSSELCCIIMVWYRQCAYTSLLWSSNTAMSHKLKCLHWGLPCFQLSFHWCLTQSCVRTQVSGLFHPNSQFSPGWILDCSVHLPYSLQGVGSTWSFCPLPQNHELFLTTHQLPPSPWVGLSWSWVCGISPPGPICTHPPYWTVPALVLFAGKGWKTGLHLGFPYLEKRKSGWTAKCLDRRGSNSSM